MKRLDEGRAVSTVYLVSSKAFHSVSHKILTKKLMKYRLDEQIMSTHSSMIFISFTIPALAQLTYDYVPLIV